MNPIFDYWVYSKDKIFRIKIFCKENYKVIIIIRFILHQNIISKCSWSSRHHEQSNLAVEGCLRWSLLTGAITAMMSIDQKGPFRDVVRYQVKKWSIKWTLNALEIFMQVLSNLVKKWNIKCPWKVAPWAVFSVEILKKKMNSNQHDIVLVKFF
jgi:hypothetical protein